MTELLKLRAKDAEDIQVISAVLQDAIVPVCDMAFDRDAKSFTVVAQRLRRETGEAGAAERICSAMTVRGVAKAQTSGIDFKQKEGMLDLLALLLEVDGLTLVFAGQARIRLVLADWGVALEDFGEAWPALCNPCHEQAS